MFTSRYLFSISLFVLLFFTDVIFELGDTIIIETPPANDNRVKDESDIPLIEQYLLDKEGGKVIAETARADANNFDENIETLVGAEDALSKKIYTPNVYAKMFCFNNKQASNTLFFSEIMLKALNGVFPKKINN